MFFDFDRFEIRIDMQSTLDQNAECLKQAVAVGAGEITIEGHCDERGSIEYNLSLGESRAEAVRRYLENLGVDATFRTVSKGESAPVCRAHNESCWAKNRRVEFIQ